MTTATPASSQPLIELVCASLAQACGVERSAVSTSTPLIDLNMDSLTLVSVVALAEAVRSVELAPDALLGLLEAPDVGGLVERLEALISADA